MRDRRVTGGGALPRHRSIRHHHAYRCTARDCRTSVRWRTPVHVFRLLGPLELRDAHGRMVSTPRRKPRALLAYLLLRAGTPVTVDELVDALWGAAPPASARANLHSYLSSLRRLLADVAPTDRTRPAHAGTGYVLHLRP